MNLVQTVYAVDTEVTQIALGNINNIGDVFGLAINIVMGVGIALTIIFLILGGIQYITSKGDQKAAQEARTSLTNAVIGFIVVIGAFTIRTVLLNVLQVEGDLIIDEVTPTGL
jgi:hypothetical protein